MKGASNVNHSFYTSCQYESMDAAVMMYQYCAGTHLVMCTSIKYQYQMSFQTKVNLYPFPSLYQSLCVETMLTSV